MEEQIKWMRSNYGIPLNGKRAGIVPSFSRFPTYVDHVLLCCRAGTDQKDTPNLAKLKDIS